MNPEVQNALDLINNIFTANGNQEITGTNSNGVLQAILNALYSITGNNEDLSTADKTNLVAAINELYNTDAFSSLKIPLIDSVVANSIYNLPALQRGESRVVAIVNDKGVYQTEASFWLGGYTGGRAGHFTWLIALENSEGGSFFDVGNKYLIINQRKQTIVYRADHFEDLPAEGDPDVIYLVEDTGNTYVWSTDSHEYVQIGSAIEGELIDEETFEETGGGVVTPTSGVFYVDVLQEPNITYRWDGNQYVPINNSTIGVDYTNLSDNVIPKKSVGVNALENSKISDSTTGVAVDGSVRGKGFIGKSITANIASSYVIDFSDMAEHYILTMTDNTSISFSNMISSSQSVVITLTVTGSFSMTLPSFLKASPSNDSYLGTANNEIVINIKKGGISPLGYYTLTNISI